MRAQIFTARSSELTVNGRMSTRARSGWSSSLERLTLMGFTGRWGRGSGC